MNVRSVIGLVLVLAVVALAVYVSQLNQDAVIVQIPGIVPLSAPLWAVLFVSLLTGVLLSLAYSVALTSREAMQRWRQGPELRQAGEIAALRKQGIHALLAGEDERARSAFAEVVRRDPTDAEAWLHAGLAARRVGDAEAATEFHLRALGLLPGDARVLDELALDAEASGDTERAVRNLRRLMESDGERPDRLRRLRDLLTASGRWEDAVGVQEQLVTQAGDGAPRQAASRVLNGLRFEAGRAALAAGDAEQAAGVAARLIDVAPAFELAHSLLAESHRRAGDRGAEESALERGFAATSSLELLRRLANLLVEVERPEDAIRTLRSAAESLRGSSALGARILLGRLYYRLELVDEAGEEFDALSELAESSAVIDYYRAKIRIRRGETESAAVLLKEALRAGHFLDHRYRCPDCGTVSDEYGGRCEPLCPSGTVELDLSVHARPAGAVEAPQV